VVNPVCHIFKSNYAPEEEAFLGLAWFAHKRPVRIPHDQNQIALSEWHYRHCIISAWGSPMLQSRLHPSSFCESEENLEFAYMYDMADDFDSPLPSSPIF